MLTPVIAQRRHWRLPTLGAIVIVRDHPLQPGHRFRRFRVVSYPGAMIRQKSGVLGPLYCFSHCVNLEALDNGDPFMVAGHLIEEM
jgi:hypothetical protein